MTRRHSCSWRCATRRRWSCTIDGGSTPYRSRPQAADRQRRERGAHARMAGGFRGSRYVRASQSAGAWPTKWSVVDDHITGVLTEHQAGRVLDMKPARHPEVLGRKSTPGPLFPQVGQPGNGLGRHRHCRSTVDHREGWVPRGRCTPGLRPLMISDHRRACAAGTCLMRRSQAGAEQTDARAEVTSASSTASARTASAAAVHRAVHRPAPAAALQRRGHRKSRCG